MFRSKNTDLVQLLTQGTGGVGTFALRSAKVVGARFIALTSSDEIAWLLEKLGSDHIINYREMPDWDSMAKEYNGGAGVDHIDEVVVPTSIKQSAAIVKLDGMSSIVSFVDGEGKDAPQLLDCWINLFTARAIWVGSRMQMEDISPAIDGSLDRLRPVVNTKFFTLGHLGNGTSISTLVSFRARSALRLREPNSQSRGQG